MAELVPDWLDRLSDEGRCKVQWMRDHRTGVSLVFAAEDPLHDLPSGEFVLELMMDRHAVFKMRGGEADLETMVDRGYEVVRNLFDYIISH